MVNVWIGIDPGLTGGIAVLGDLGLFFVKPMPTVKVSSKGFVKNALNATEAARILRPFAGPDTVALVERVNAFPGQGVASMFSLGWSYGGILAVLATLGIPTLVVEAKDWKAHFKLTKDKELARALAVRLFPTVSLPNKGDHGQAEALLIALFGRHQSTIKGPE